MDVIGILAAALIVYAIVRTDKKINSLEEQISSLKDQVKALQPSTPSAYDSWTDEDDDPLYEQAKKAVIENGKASTSFIQRKLRVGYSRSARLMDMLEENGVVGPVDGGKPREILQKGDN